MATRIETVQLAVPAGTPIATPVSALLYQNRAEIQQLELLFPPGPSGFVGVRLDHSNRQVIPKVDGTWIIADSETIKWDLTGYSVQPDWHLRAYNTDVYAHTIYARVLLNDYVTPPPSTVDLISIE